ncbi:hypothetical protein ACHHYP_08645 [Achlya hypogyna]|uniref:Uncharacterized protein n=1 Tax=Achlya hypogyna TaxID=1202772 RepID=A0A1V9ZKI3_ACHHY|nr:hypothetical protein ACHHYP_08645 [Achlya hypogyna]
MPQVLLVKTSVKTSALTALFAARDDFRCQDVRTSPADILFCARPGVAPALPILLFTARDALESIVTCVKTATATFPIVYGIVLFPATMPPLLHRQLQALSMNPEVDGKLRVFPASSSESAFRAILHVRDKHQFETIARAETFYIKMAREPLSKDHERGILAANLRFLTDDDCEMLLDIFGSIANLARASAKDLLRHTVLDRDSAELVAEFFQPHDGFA